MEVHVQIDGAPEALDGRDGAAPAAGHAPATGAAALKAKERPCVDTEHRPAEPMVPGAEIAQAVRQAQHPLADRDRRQHMVDEVRRPLSHPPPAAARADGARLARERHQALGVTGIAAKACEAMLSHATGEEPLESSGPSTVDHSMGGSGGRDPRRAPLDLQGELRPLPVPGAGGAWLRPLPQVHARLGSEGRRAARESAGGAGGSRRTVRLLSVNSRRAQPTGAVLMRAWPL